MRIHHTLPLPIFSLVWICLLAVAMPPTVVARQPFPNVILIIADDLGYGELGCYGGTEIPTPNIDQLANSGLRFTDGYVTASYCAASRAALLTGRYQTRFGFEFNPIGAVNCEPGVGLPIDQKTIADNLRDAGYATGLVGKWHLGGTAPFHPQRRGFDEFFGFLHEGHFFVPPPYAGTTTWLRRKVLPYGGRGRWVAPNAKIFWSTDMGHNEPPYDTDNPILRSSQPITEQENLTDGFTREACDFILRHQAQPFFLCLAYNAVHSPLQADDKYFERFSHIEDVQRRIFAAMLSHLDDGIGKVVGTLTAAGLRDNSLIIFLSDNGGPTKELTSSNSPLRGGKGSVYEGGVRVPMIVNWPQEISPNVVETPVISTDIAATLADLLNVAQEGRGVDEDGQSWLPIFKGKPTSEQREFFWRMGNRNAIRVGDWKAVRQQSTVWELYDLASDIGESNNLAGEKPGKLSELTDRWEAWNQLQVEPLWR